MNLIYDNLNILFTLGNIQIKVFCIEKKDVSHPIPNHMHGDDYYEMHYISDGTGKIKFRDDCVCLSPQMMFLARPHIPYELIPDSSEHFIEYCIHIEANLINSDKPFFYNPQANNIICVKDTQHIHFLFKEIFAELSEIHTGYLLSVSALVQLCLIKLVRSRKLMPPPQYDNFAFSQIDRRKLIIENSFLYEYNTITLETLSKRIGLSERQTERFIQNYYKETFIQKRNETRMSAARSFLAHTSLSISEIAEKVGYTSVKYFSQIFHSWYQCSPSSYRKKKQDDSL